ncbi:MAG: aminoglycoside phosphotransferase family protein [Anaerolineae bacterium]
MHVLNVTPQSKPPLEAQRWVESILGRPLMAINVMLGSTSAAVYHLIAEGGNEYVLRLFTSKSWLQSEPDLAKHEAFTLIEALAANILTPELIGFDETGQDTVFPAVLMTKLAGSVELQPFDIDLWVEQLAESLFEIHSLDIGDGFAWHYKHWYLPQELQVPSWSRKPKAFRQLVEFLQDPSPKLPTVFLHRDYHPTNVLWENGKISGVVDWVNGCVGPAMVDVSHCRLNLVGLYGVDVADKFLRAWLNLAGPNSYSLWWDINGLANGGVFEEPISVYRGWADFGKSDITVEQLAFRMDQYIEALAAEIMLNP